MSTALTIPQAETAMAPPAAIIESLALKGDISNLNSQERVLYYRHLCDRVGVDPLTQPFSPLRLNGKEVLYANKGCTDQLSQKHGITREVVARERIDDVYVVTARASLPTGRHDDSIGAVPVGGLKGEALANAMMKAETKAKRRATLSLMGLGMLDESELETIPAQAIAAAPPIAAAPKRQRPEDRPLGIGQAYKATRLGDIPTEELERSLHWCRHEAKNPARRADLADDIERVLASRQGVDTTTGEVIEDEAEDAELEPDA